MPQNYTSAGRLYAEARRIKQSLYNHPTPYLALKIAYEGKFFQGLIALEKLLVECKNDIKNYDVRNKDKYLNALQNIESIINPENFSHGRDVYCNSFLNEDSLEKIESLDEILEGKGASCSIDEQSFKEISSEIEEIIEFASKIENSIKYIVIDSLTDLKIKIENLNLYNPDEILSTAIYSISKIKTLDVDEKLVNEDAGPSLYNKILKVCGNVVNTCMKIKTKAEPVLWVFSKTTDMVKSITGDGAP